MNGQWKVSEDGRGTRGGRSSATVPDYAFRITDHGTVLVARTSVELHYPKTCQDENQKKKFEDKAKIESGDLLAQKKTISRQDSRSKDQFVGQCDEKAGVALH